MIRMSVALIVSIFAVLLTGKPLIKFLKINDLKQTMYELGPESHFHKAGTPIMGGFLFIYSSLLLSFILHKESFNLLNDFTIVNTIFMILTMFIGFADDYVKAYKHRNLGLNAKQKLICQFIIAIAFSAYCAFNKNIGTHVFIPFTSRTIDLGYFYIPLLTLTIVFIVNSANIQDGMDGLLSSVSIVGFLCWGLIAVSYFQNRAINFGPQSSIVYLNVAIFCFALAGGCMGFLRFNYYPAKIFMGDTGSMFIGAAAVAVAMILKQPFLLLFIFFTPIMSSFSVIIQRVYFKITKGKRIFKMSPIHHHFEKSGYTETQVITLYTVITTVLSMLAVLSIYSLTTGVL